MMFRIAAVFLILTAAPAWGESESFQKAYSVYAYGDYKDAARQFHALLYPPVLTDESEILKAHQYLSICYYVLNQRIAAENEFRTLLRLRPEYTLDPLFTPPEIIRYFSALKEEMGREKTEMAQKKRAQFILSVVPFGVGQFQNRDMVKGYVLLGVQSAALLTNIGTYYSRKTMETSPDHYASGDMRMANSLQNAQMIAFWTFIGAGIYGIVDAMWNFSPGVPPPPQTAGRGPDG